MMRKASYTEEELLRALKRLQDHWPRDTHWVYTASGSFHVMRLDPQGKRARIVQGKVDPAYIVETFAIPADGGDW